MYIKQNRTLFNTFYSIESFCLFLKNTKADCILIQYTQECIYLQHKIINRMITEIKNQEKKNNKYVCLE